MYPQQETESKAEDKTEGGEESDDLSQLLSLQPDEFAQGIANLVEYVMTNKEKKPSIINAMLGTGAPQENSLLLTDGTATLLAGP